MNARIRRFSVTEGLFFVKSILRREGVVDGMGDTDDTGHVPEATRNLQYGT